MKIILAVNRIYSLILFINLSFLFGGCSFYSTDNNSSNSDSIQVFDSIKSKESEEDSLSKIDYYNDKKRLLTLSKSLLTDDSNAKIIGEYTIKAIGKGDTTLFDITVDTLLYPNDTTCLVLYKYVRSGASPCSHADASEYKLGFFRLAQRKFSCLKISETLSTRGPWCDRPELALLKFKDRNYILFIANDGHSGHFRNYVTVVSANLSSLGECYINFESPTKSEKIDFLQVKNMEIDPSKLERTTSYDGIFKIDTSELWKGCFQFVNEFYVIKNFGWSEKEVGDTIFHESDLREYLIVADSIVPKKQIIKTPEWAM